MFQCPRLPLASLTAIALVTWAPPARSAELTDIADRLSISIDDSATLYGNIENCTDRMDKAYTVTGRLEHIEIGQDPKEGEFSLSLVYVRGSAECLPDEVDACTEGRAATPSGGDNECRCLASAIQTDGELLEQVTTTVTPSADLWEEACADKQEGELFLNIDYFQPPELNEEPTYVRGTQVVKIVVDRVRPPAPTVAPRARPDSGSLFVSYDPVDNPDVHTYSICYKPRIAGVTAPEIIEASDTATNNDLETPNFTCQSEGVHQTSTVITGLDNDVSYWIVYATYDRAGNRSANSPAAEAMPRAGVQGLAKRYVARGGVERGGCQHSGGRGSLGALLLGVALVAGLRRMRRRNQVV